MGHVSQCVCTFAFLTWQIYMSLGGFQSFTSNQVTHTYTRTHTHAHTGAWGFGGWSIRLAGWATTQAWMIMQSTVIRGTVNTRTRGTNDAHSAVSHLFKKTHMPFNYSNTSSPSFDFTSWQMCTHCTQVVWNEEEGNTNFQISIWAHDIFRPSSPNINDLEQLHSNGVASHCYFPPAQYYFWLSVNVKRQCFNVCLFASNTTHQRQTI